MVGNLTAHHDALPHQCPWPLILCAGYFFGEKSPPLILDPFPPGGKVVHEMVV
jgi:hypothetical protein